MSRFPVEVRLEPPDGEAISENSPLVKDVKRDLQEAANKEGVDLTGPERTPPPPGAQGDFQMLQWLWEILPKEPEEIAAYKLSIRYTLWSLRDRITYHRPENAKQNKLTIKVRLFNRDIDLLTVTTPDELEGLIDDAIEEWLGGEE